MRGAWVRCDHLLVGIPGDKQTPRIVIAEDIGHTAKTIAVVRTRAQAKAIADALTNLSMDLPE